MSQSVPGTFVEPRGMVRSIVAATAGRQLMGMVGSTAAGRAAEASTAGASPMKPGQIAYLDLGEEELTLFRAKRGAFRPKATDEAIARAPRSAVSGAAVERGRFSGVLTVTFTDDSTWIFDVPKVHLGGADEIASALG